MTIADDVAAAMADDSLWESRVSDKEPDAADDRALALDEFEQASGLRLPEVYRYLVIHEPNIMTSDRLYSDIDLPVKRTMGPLLLTNVASRLRRMAEAWRSGTFERVVLLGPSDAGPVIDAWLPYLFKLFHHDGAIMYDFRFDPVNPPVIVFQEEAGFEDLPPRAMMVYIADDLLSFLRLELRTDENYTDTPSDPPTQRCIAWTEWRNTELIPQVVAVYHRD